MSKESLYLDHSAITELLDRMAEALKQKLQQTQAEDPAMIGIHTGGVWIAQHLHRKLGLEIPLGTLDISFYRDDFTRIGLNPRVRPSSVPFDVENRHIVLVDDVIQSGRTIRAAMNEIFDFGRPASIILVSLLDRPGRELPIQPDIIGQHLELQDSQHIRLLGPEPLTLKVASKHSSRNKD